jgi:hypothetical protein
LTRWMAHPTLTQVRSKCGICGAANTERHRRHHCCYVSCKQGTHTKECHSYAAYAVYLMPTSSTFPACRHQHLQHLRAQQSCSCTKTHTTNQHPQHSLPFLHCLPAGISVGSIFGIYKPRTHATALSIH